MSKSPSHSRVPCHNSPFSQRGIIVFLMALLSFFLIGLIGFAIDTFRLVLAVRQLQDAADMSARSSVSVLTPDIEIKTAEDEKIALNNFQNVKKVVAEILPRVKIQDASAIPNQPFTERNKTTLDQDNFKYDEALHTNLIVHVRRGLWCFDGPNFIPFFDIDNSSETALKELSLSDGTIINVSLKDYYCRANSVMVELIIPEFRTFFIRLLGIRKINSITRSTVATVRTKLGGSLVLCGQPQCKDLLTNLCAVRP